MAAPIEPTRQYVLLPPRGLHGGQLTGGVARRFLTSIAPDEGLESLRASSEPNIVSGTFRVLDEIREDGPKLVELSDAAALELRALQPGLRLAPVLYYEPAAHTYRVQTVSSTRRVADKLSVQVVSAAVGRTPLAGVSVVAFTDFKSRTGAQGKTNQKGEVLLRIDPTSTPVERLYVETPAAGFWGALRRNITDRSVAIFLRPIDLGHVDGLRHFYGHAPDDAGAGVRVAVIDTGVSPDHADLTLAGGANTVEGEAVTDFGDNGLRHGTHVAGIIAAAGIAPVGLRGLAPAVMLHSYRVFGQNAQRAKNYAIAKAIDRAVADGCDLINMSLGGGPVDAVLADAIADARSAGCLVIVAAGNDGRRPVAYPAADPLAIAVSAMGRRGTFPAGSFEAGYIAAPFGTDARDFIAAFSNVGSEIDVTGIGVGILSTVPGGYAPMSGTSMACPAVTGVVARLLGANPDLLMSSRDQDRSDSLAQMLLTAARVRGFGPMFEGHGLPE